METLNLNANMANIKQLFSFLKSYQDLLRNGREKLALKRLFICNFQCCCLPEISISLVFFVDT